MSQIIWVNDKDIEVDVVSVSNTPTELEAWGAALTFDRETASLPGAIAGVAGPDARVGPRMVRIQTLLNATNLVTRDAELSKLTDLFPVDTLVELRFGDSPDKVLEGVVQAERSAAYAGELSFTYGAIYVGFDILCADGSKRDRFASCRVLGNFRKAIPLGNLPSAGIITINGSGSDPVITYRDAGGNTVGTMTLTVTLGADDRIVIDLYHKTIKRFDNGVETDAINTWTAGDWFVTDANDGDYATSSWPTLQCTLAGKYNYLKRWRN